MDIYIIGIIISVIVLILIIILGEQTGKKRIQNILENKGYQVVIVRAINQLGRHHSRVYEAQYYDQNNTLHINSCLVDTSTFTERIVSWKEPLE